MVKKALITGITGQDGAYLTDLLLEKGYQVHGIIRRSSSFNTGRIDHIYQDPHEDHIRLKLHYGDLTDATNLIRLIGEIEPDEVYNLGAMSHVKVSFDSPEYTANVDGLGTLRLLEAIRLLRLEQSCRFYQAATSELFGMAQEVPQNEKTPFYPRSPYGVAKLYAYWTVINHREAYGIYACNGILFNHESPKRGKTFVTRKITRAAARIVLGVEERLYLGNLDAQRDWGHAKDYVQAMWLMLQQEEAKDYVIASGQSITVRDFAKRAFSCLGLIVEFFGTSVNEIGKVVASKNTDLQSLIGKEVIRIDPYYYRPTEVDLLVGDASKAKEELGWSPEITLDEMIEEMVKADLEKEKKLLH